MLVRPVGRWTPGRRGRRTSVLSALPRPSALQSGRLRSPAAVVLDEYADEQRQPKQTDSVRDGVDDISAVERHHGNEVEGFSTKSASAIASTA